MQVKCNAANLIFSIGTCNTFLPLTFIHVFIFYNVQDIMNPFYGRVTKDHCVRNPNYIETKI